jgi:hypothetical protein
MLFTPELFVARLAALIPDEVPGTSSRLTLAAEFALAIVLFAPPARRLAEERGQAVNVQRVELADEVAGTSSRQTSMPCPLRGMATDDGAEFVDDALLLDCPEAKIECTRGPRPEERMHARDTVRPPARVRACDTGLEGETSGCSGDARSFETPRRDPINAVKSGNSGGFDPEILAGSDRVS